jgi:hypothetical protein
LRASSTAPSGAANRKVPSAPEVNRSRIGTSADSPAAPSSRTSAPATGEPSRSTTRPTRSAAGARWISIPRTWRPRTASSWTGLWPHSGANGRNPGAVTAASRQRPSSGGSKRKRPSGPVRVEAAAPPREKVRSAPSMPAPVTVPTTRPSKLAGRRSGLSAGTAGTTIGNPDGGRAGRDGTASTSPSRTGARAGAAGSSRRRPRKTARRRASPARRPSSAVRRGLCMSPLIYTGPGLRFPCSVGGRRRVELGRGREGVGAGSGVNPRNPHLSVRPRS